MARRKTKNYTVILKPFGYQWLLSATGIAGPGNMVVVYAGPGDFYVACISYDNKVLWNKSCGMIEVET